jgi:hypothetical protein
MRKATNKIRKLEQKDQSEQLMDFSDQVSRTELKL